MFIHNSRELFIALEIQLQRELDDSWVYRSARNRAKCRRRNVAVGIVELRVIEDVEKFRAELDVAAFAQQTKRRPLDDG